MECEDAIREFLERPGDVPPDLWRCLKMCLLRQMRRRGTLHVSPAVWGYAGRSWRESDAPAARSSGRAPGHRRTSFSYLLPTQYMNRSDRR
jgi:hypothetical protein